jgi:hypothetical protein
MWSLSRLFFWITRTHVDRASRCFGSPARRHSHRIALSLCFLFKAGRMIENFLARAVQFPGIATRYDWVSGDCGDDQSWLCERSEALSGLGRDSIAIACQVRRDRDCFVASLLARSDVTEIASSLRSSQ